jgi:hypothetical protein
MGAYGRSWRKVNLTMVNVYIDDSGTAPDQRIAIASALVIPANRIRLLEVEWENFKEKYGIGEKGFHSAECASRNHKTEFGNWDKDKVTKAFDRVSAITTKYGVYAVSFAVKKTDYDDLMPTKWKNVGGYLHYTWAIKHVLKLLRIWDEATCPTRTVEYFFDWQDGEPKREIEKMMEMEELVRPGKYEGHYSFRKRKEIPALQCTDLLAWMSLAKARLFFENTPMNEHAERVRVKFNAHRSESWLVGATVARGVLAETIRRNLVNSLDEDQRKEWYRLHGAECITRD